MREKIARPEIVNNDQYQRWMVIGVIDAIILICVLLGWAAGR